MNPSKIDLLMLRFQHSDEDIAASGLAQSVGKAEAWRDRKLETAARHLTDFSVSLSDLREFIDQHLRHRFDR
jgi:hypothetical protein